MSYRQNFKLEILSEHLIILLRLGGPVPDFQIFYELD